MRTDRSTDTTIPRRDFLRCLACGGAGIGSATVLGLPAAASSRPARLHEAMHYKRLSRNRTQCLLCPNKCVRSSGRDGQCRARGNRGGSYYSLVHGRPCVIALDEVEKLPLNHFRSQGKAFSLATAGCNLSCHYCQNWMFSQSGPDDVPKSYDLSPEEVVAKAVENKAGAIAYFYTEPTVYYEYMLDIAKQAREHNLKNIMVTAGYINPEPLEEILPFLDAVVLGIKGWNEEFYREYVGGELKYVKQTARILSETKDVWWEAVNLVLPSLNDNMEEIAWMADWLGETTGPERPLHFTRFRPEYRLKRLPMTPASVLTSAREVALERGLKHVYVGNMPGHEGANTICPGCGETVVERMGFMVLSEKVADGKCAFCDRKIGGVWS
jgi:pyruvate formate lyase activating enzyme